MHTYCLIKSQQNPASHECTFFMTLQKLKTQPKFCNFFTVCGTEPLYLIMKYCVLQRDRSAFLCCICDMLMWISMCVCAGVMSVSSVCYSVKENGEEACKELMEAFAACVKSNAEASWGAQHAGKVMHIHLLHSPLLGQTSILFMSDQQMHRYKKIYKVFLIKKNKKHCFHVMGENR